MFRRPIRSVAIECRCGGPQWGGKSCSAHRVSGECAVSEAAMTQGFKATRDFLLAHRTDYVTAYRDFRWPELDRFNWALDGSTPSWRGTRAVAGRRCASSAMAPRPLAS